MDAPHHPRRLSLSAAGRLVSGRPYLFLSIAAGIATYLALPKTIFARISAGIIAWDTAGLVLLLLYAMMFAGETEGRIERDAEAQETGEWSIFWITVCGTIACLTALLIGLTGQKNRPPHLQDAWLGLVGVTLLLSWLVTHTLFAVRYAHEYYERKPGAGDVMGGLEFPGDRRPDYWDFVYFAIVLGMTFQVSDVQITCHKLRRLAAAHGLLGFLFNTVILALAINLIAGLI